MQALVSTRIDLDMLAQVRFNQPSTRCCHTGKGHHGAVGDVIQRRVQHQLFRLPVCH